MMKKFITLSIIALITSCSGTPGEFSIKGMADTKDGTMIYRIVADANNQPMIIDSVAVASGKFKMSGIAETPDIQFLSVQSVNGNFPLIVETGTIKTSIYKDSISSSRAYGTVSNDGFMTYKAETKMFVTSLNAIGKDMQQARFAKDSLLSADLQEQYFDVQGQIKDYELEFIKTNADSYISPLILERFLSSKQISNDEVKTLFDGFTERIKASKSGQNIAKLIDVPEAPAPAKIGQLAPDFNGPDHTGKNFTLKENLGKITIVDFWASWCRPCRVENPNLVNTYNKLHGKGLEIISVSLDKDKKSWIRAIEDDGLKWDGHVSNLKFWNEPIAKLYQVTSIPATFILDENGKIIAKNLRGLALEQKIEELLLN